MITKFKLFENAFEKPIIDSDDFAFHWQKWARAEIRDKVGDVYYSAGAEWGGFWICELSDDEYNGYFLVEDEYGENWILHYRDYNDNTEEEIHNDLFSSNMYDDNLDLLIELGNFVKSKPDISIKDMKEVIYYIYKSRLGEKDIDIPVFWKNYLRKKQSKKFKI